MKKSYFVLNSILFCISSIAAAWYLGGGILVGFDDFSKFFNDFSRYFEYFSFNVLISGSVSLLFSSFFGRNVLKSIRDGDYLRKRKFKILLPVAGVLITILGALLLITYGFVLSKLEPTNPEIGIGVAFGLITMSLGGLIFTIILGIIGLLIDRAILKKNISSILNLLKVLIITFTLIIVLSFIINAINSFKIGCSPSDNKCLLEKAISEQDPNVCGKSDWCYMRYYETQNSSVCASMPDKIDTLGGGVIYYNYRDKCYEYFAYREKNAVLCDLIQDESKKNHCLSDI